MVVSEIKSKYNALLDSFYSGSIPNRRLNSIFAHAGANYFEKLMNQYQLTNSITAELQPLILKMNVSPTNNEVDMADITDVKRVLAVKATFSDGRENWAKELATEELGSIYSRGTTRYPRYYMVANTILIQPETPTCTGVEVVYFRKPYDINFDNPNDDIPYLEVTVERLIEEALAVTAKVLREDGFYAQSDKETKENMN